MIGDILEISAQFPDLFVGVQPLRYTVTAEDVLRSRIQAAGVDRLRDTIRDGTVAQLPQSV